MAPEIKQDVREFGSGMCLWVSPYTPKITAFINDTPIIGDDMPR